MEATAEQHYGLPEIRLSEYTYDLPEALVAQYPLENRANSKLLHFRDGVTEHKAFADLPSLIPQGHALFFNNTKVIPARLFFNKDSGALIEVFLMSPIEPHTDVSLTMASYRACTWECVLGNAKRVKENTVLYKETLISGQKILVSALIKDKERRLVEFSWDAPEVSFAEIIESIGNMPIPPYLNRPADSADGSAYQTVYGKIAGAVAAPTAGLHFTPSLLTELKNKGVQTDELTLHVGGGTFRPVKAENALEHDMHSEQIYVSQDNIRFLLSNPKIIAVGTTSLRALESLYWIGVKLSFEKKTLKENELLVTEVEKLYPYSFSSDVSLPNRTEALETLLSYMKLKGMDRLSTQTRIFIFPGYDFRMVDALITNYHQPQSTLLMLVSAFIGPCWKDLYEEAIANKYRFFSYGDSSLLFKNR